MDNLVVDFKEAFIVQEDLTEVIGNLNFQVKEGELVYIMGKSGAGKTSLLKTIYSALPLKQGFASVLNFDLKDLKRSELPMLRRQLGMVFQNFELLEDKTIFGNLAFVLRSTGTKKKTQIQDRIAAVLEQVKVLGKEQKYPYQLSGGEQQRIAIARALLNKPKLILADEPTGNLDAETSDEILEILNTIANQGTAVLIATHDHRLVNKYPGTVYRIEDGVLDKTSLF